jgi:hypothetical protein
MEPVANEIRLIRARYTCFVIGRGRNRQCLCRLLLWLYLVKLILTQIATPADHRGLLREPVCDALLRAAHSGL